MPRQPAPLTPHDIAIPDGTLTHYDTNRVNLPALKEPVLDNIAAAFARLRQTAEAAHLTTSP